MPTRAGGSQAQPMSGSCNSAPGPFRSMLTRRSAAARRRASVHRSTANGMHSSSPCRRSSTRTADVGDDRLAAHSQVPVMDAPFDPAIAEQTLPEAFASVVDRYRERVAVVDGTAELSFAALDRRSGAVAAAL